MKKTIAMIITLVLLISCSLIAAIPSSAEELQINYDDFDIIDGVIIEYLGPGGAVIVPSVDKDGNEVTKIDASAFKGNKNLTAVYICEGITEIGHSAFRGCTNLTEVSLPYSLEVLGKYEVFAGTSIASLTVPAKVKELPDTLVTTATGENAPGIDFTDLIISDGVEVIRKGAIYLKGTEIIIPESVYLIEGGAFKWSSKELNIYICNRDCTLGGFEGQDKIYLPNSTTRYDYEGDAPIALLWDSKEMVKIYAPREAEGIRQTVEKYKTDGSYGSAYKGGNYQFIGLSEERLAEMQAEIKEQGIYKATEYQMSTQGGLTTPDNSSNNANNNAANNNNQTGNNAVNNQGQDNTLLIVIIVCATLLIIVVLVIVVVMLNMKDKKKKKRKKKIAAPKPEVEQEAEQENTETETSENLE